MSPSKATFGPEVNCPHCSGTGKIRLTIGHWRVYSLVEQGYDTAKAIHQQLDSRDDIEQQAVNKRLEQLRKYGLLTRDPQKRGRQWVYGVAREQK